MEDSETNPQIPLPSKPISNKDYCCSLPNCKCNTLLYCLAAFLILIILSGVAYLHSIRSQPLTYPPPILKNKVTLIPTSYSTTNWKAYTNKKYGFFLKYPNSFSDSTGPPYDLTVKDNLFTFDIKTNSDTNTYNNWIRLINEDLINKEENVKAMNIQNHKIYFESRMSNEGIFERNVIIPFLDNGVIHMTLSADTKSQKYSEQEIYEIVEYTADQILSTFRFTDNNQESYSLDTNIPNQKRYVSPKLGISFLYLTIGFSVKEEGQKIYVYRSDDVYTSGQHVEVFSKKPEESLKDAITVQFLSGKDPSKCFVEQRNHSKKPNFSIAEISYPRDSDDYEKMIQSIEYCSPGYAITNGSRYFLGDSSHPSKFLFFSIGQYTIFAASMNDDGWQNTISFLD